MEKVNGLLLAIASFLAIIHGHHTNKHSIATGNRNKLDAKCINDEKYFCTTVHDFIGNTAAPKNCSDREFAQRCKRFCGICTSACISGNFVSESKPKTVYSHFSSLPNVTYFNKERCNFKILPPKEHEVSVKMERFDLEIRHDGECLDSLQITTPDEPKKIFCGKEGLGWNKTAKWIHFSFTTDKYVTKPGFRMSYQTKIGCQSRSKKLLPYRTEFIQSHDKFDGKKIMYEPNDHCRWNFEANKNKVVEIQFKIFKLEGKHGSCKNDVVKIWSGDIPVLHTGFTDPDFEFCGSSEDIIGVTGHGKYMTIEFQTNGSNQKLGFSAEIIEREPVCPPELTNELEDYVRILSGFGSKCKWYINEKASLYFTEVSVNEKDSISFYKTDNTTLIRRVKGPELNKQKVHETGFLGLIEYTSPTTLSPTARHDGFDIRVIKP